MAGHSGGGFHGASIGAWLATFVIIVGTILGSIGLIEWNWLVFWIGVGVFVVGWIAAYLFNIMDAVTEYGGQSGGGGGGGSGDPSSSASFT